MFVYKDKHHRIKQTHKMVSVVGNFSIILPSSSAHRDFVEIETAWKQKLM